MDNSPEAIEIGDRRASITGEFCSFMIAEYGTEAGKGYMHHLTDSDVVRLVFLAIRSPDGQKHIRGSIESDEAAREVVISALEGLEEKLAKIAA